MEIIRHQTIRDIQLYRHSRRHTNAIGYDGIKDSVWCQKGIDITNSSAKSGITKPGHHSGIVADQWLSRHKVKGGFVIGISTLENGNGIGQWVNHRYQFNGHHCR